MLSPIRFLPSLPRYARASLKARPRLLCNLRYGPQGENRGDLRPRPGSQPGQDVSSGHKPPLQLPFPWGEEDASAPGEGLLPFPLGR